MPDQFSPEKRSEIMSHIHSVDTKPEIFSERLCGSGEFVIGKTQKCLASQMSPSKNIRWQYLLMVTFGTVTTGKLSIDHLLKPNWNGTRSIGKKNTAEHGS
jgi:hypothetical protein